MAERDFQSLLAVSCRELARGGARIHMVPIPDPGKAVRFGVKKVYDFGLVVDGHYHGVELKQVPKRGWGWSIRLLAPHQEENLLACEAAGCPGWVMVHFCCTCSATRRRKGWPEALNECWAARIDQVLAERRAGETSLDVEWWRSHGVEVVQFKARDEEGRLCTYWDPRHLVAGQAERHDRPAPQELELQVESPRRRKAKARIKLPAGQLCLPGLEEEQARVRVREMVQARRSRSTVVKTVAREFGITKALASHLWDEVAS